MKRASILASAVLGTLLLAVPVQSQAFFGFFGGGFGGGGWDGPGWRGPGYYWRRPWHFSWYRPYSWRYRHWYPYWADVVPPIGPFAVLPTAQPAEPTAPVALSGK